MTIIKWAIAFAAMLLLSCQGKSGAEGSGKSLAEVEKKLTEYITQKDTNLLLEAYRLLSSNGEYVEDGVTAENYQVVMPLLMYLRKYDELENLIKSGNFTIRERRMTLNLISALKIYEKDSVAARRYIIENIDSIKRKLLMDPGDSLLYVDYFIMRAYLVGKEEALLDLDSFNVENNVLSPDFSEYVLRDVIEEYPNEFLFPE